MASNKKRSVSGAQSVANRTTSASTQPAGKTASTTRASFTQEFNPDYTHVMRDLKQIGIMAASFLVILVALSFFLR